MNKIKSCAVSVLILLAIFLCEQFLNNYDELAPSSNATPVVQNLEGDLKMHFIDVGQGDAIFIELPNGETLLIDAGEAWKANNVFNYVNQNLGYITLNYIVATHPHSDHIGGLSLMLDSFNVNNIYMTKATSTSKTYENLLESIDFFGLKINTAKAGTILVEEEDLLVEIVSPVNDTYSNTNNYSAIVKITYNEISAIFMGDAEELIEEALVNSGDIQNVDVVKVGHHGSDSSSIDEFVTAANAKFAIISVGEGNTYNHPSADVVKKWEVSGSSVYQTDIHGNIVITTDGKSLSVEYDG